MWPRTLPHERRVLLLDRPMAMVSASVVHRPNGPRQARTSGLECQEPTPISGPLPIQRKPEKIDAVRPLTSLLSFGRSSKGHEARLVRMEGQPIHLHPLSQPHHHSLRIVLAFESKPEVITIPDKDGLPPEVWRDFGFSPPIEGNVEINVPEDRGEDRFLGPVPMSGSAVESCIAAWIFHI